MLTNAQKAFLTSAVAAAKEAEKQTKCPSAITVCQAIIESGWGIHAPQFNVFGIKSYHGEHGRQLLSTTEYFDAPELARFLALGDGREAYATDITAPDGRRKYKVKDWFATYASLSDAFIQHGVLLTQGHPYRDAYNLYAQNGDLNSFISHVALKYATALNYGEQIRQVLGMQEVKNALAAAG